MELHYWTINLRDTWPELWRRKQVYIPGGSLGGMFGWRSYELWNLEDWRAGAGGNFAGAFDGEGCVEAGGVVGEGGRFGASMQVVVETTCCQAMCIGC